MSSCGILYKALRFRPTLHYQSTLLDTNLNPAIATPAAENHNTKDRNPY
jgi:hypothetical protein